MNVVNIDGQLFNINRYKYIRICNPIMKHCNALYVKHRLQFRFSFITYKSCVLSKVRTKMYFYPACIWIPIDYLIQWILLGHLVIVKFHNPGCFDTRITKHRPFWTSRSFHWETWMFIHESFNHCFSNRRFSTTRTETD